MAEQGECRGCGGATEIIDRRIGFFGLQETRCTHCRDCLKDAAKAQGLDPDAVLQEYDERLAAIVRGSREYEARNTAKRARNQRR